MGITKKQILKPPSLSLPCFIVTVKKEIAKLFRNLLFELLIQSDDLFGIQRVLKG